MSVTRVIVVVVVVVVVVAVLREPRFFVQLHWTARRQNSQRRTRIPHPAR